MKKKQKKRSEPTYPLPSAELVFSDLVMICPVCGGWTDVIKKNVCHGRLYRYRRCRRCSRSFKTEERWCRPRPEL